MAVNVGNIGKRSIQGGGNIQIRLHQLDSCLSQLSQSRASQIHLAGHGPEVWLTLVQKTFDCPHAGASGEADEECFIH